MYFKLKKNIMKLYHLNPNNYGQEYFTVANSKEEAMGNIKKYLLSKTENENDCYIKGYISDYNSWKDVNIDNLPGKYTLDEHNIGDVIESEIC